MKIKGITDECFNHIVDYIRPGMTEKQIAREIDYFYYITCIMNQFYRYFCYIINTNKRFYLK